MDMSCSSSASSMRFSLPAKLLSQKFRGVPARQSAAMQLNFYLRQARHLRQLVVFALLREP